MCFLWALYFLSCWTIFEVIYVFFFLDRGMPCWHHAGLLQERTVSFRSLSCSGVYGMRKQWCYFVRLSQEVMFCPLSQNTMQVFEMCLAWSLTLSHPRFISICVERQKDQDPKVRSTLHLMNSRNRVDELQRSFLILPVIALLLWTFGSLVVWSRWSNTGPRAIDWNAYRLDCLFADSSLACSEVVRCDWSVTLFFVEKQNNQVFVENNLRQLLVEPFGRPCN